jgi:hypothetical protein
MSAFADIEQLIRPTALTSFRGEMAPVICNIWQGGDSFKKVVLDKVYPFDTVENIKRIICTRYKDDAAFIPRFVFMGIKVEERTYLPAEYYLYPIDKDSNETRNTMILKDPRDSLESADPRFVTPDGSFPPIIVKPHGRSTLEDMYLNVRGEIPEFWLFTLRDLIAAYKGPKPISEAAWNSKFYPYFYDRNLEWPYKPSNDDLAFAKIIHNYVEGRTKQIDVLNSYLEDSEPVPEVQVTGVRMLRLEIQKPPSKTFPAEALFYNLKVNERRPFMRLLPTSGTPVSKVHVNGIIPIPTLDNPELIRDWAKEQSPTVGKDYFFIKYLHTPRISYNQCSVYGTVRVAYNGVIDVMVQPPRDRRKLEPTTDFKNFKTVLSQAIEGLPHSIDSFKLGEAAVLFSLKTGVRDPKFNRKRLEARLPIFQSFFQPITALPGQNPILAIRYKAVSQYASDSRIFSFITQFVTKQMLDGLALEAAIIREISTNFQLTDSDAKKIFENWKERDSKAINISSTPDENEFMDQYNPGIDIYVYAQHPIYTVHVNRIDSFDNFQRIFTLIGLLFMDDDNLFRISVPNLANSEEKLEEELLEREDEAEGKAEEEQTAAEEFKEFIDTGFTEEELELLRNTADLDEQALEAAAPVAAAISGAMGETTTAAPAASSKAAAATAVKETPIGPLKDRVVKPKVDEDDDAPIIPNNWFINKLIDIDPVLFKYTPKIKTKGYSRICQVIDDKQPAVMNPEQYERLREEYLPDEERGEVFFKEYPLDGKEDPKVPRGAEVYTILKFGSDAARPNYFFCPALYCLRDQIMIREKDFAAEVDRKGNPKDKDSCPFCGGKIITNRDTAMTGRTVIRKKAKEASGNQPIHIGFHLWDTKKFLIKDTAHPAGFALPCCGIKDQNLRLKYDVFEKFREQKAAAAATGEVPKREEDEVETSKVGEIDFAVLFAGLHTEYIVGAEKFPLLIGKFAVVPPTFEQYFAQDSTKFINRTAIRQELKPKGSGFLRVGIENSNTESVLAVVAPLLNRSYISEVKELILEKCVPRIFIHANFGNLIHEFYAPADVQPTDNELRKWASRYLQLDVTSDNKLSVMRVYLSYNRFVEFIKDSKKPKDLRHIAPLLAEPGLFSPRGIQLVVLDWDSTRPNDPVTVRCPAYGLSFERHKRADFAFISRNVRSTDSKCSTSSIIVNYELFIHTFNQPGGGEMPDTHIVTPQWKYTERPSWPSVVQTRVDEYLEQCKTRYTSLYTPQSGVNSLTLIPLSKAIGTLTAEGIIRDSYNHAVALTFKTRDKGVSPLVAFPIVDDGHFYGMQLRIHLDWDDFTKAPLEEALKFYREVLALIFKFDLNTGYVPIRAVHSEYDEWAIQLKNGIFIPVGAPTRGTEGLDIEIDEVEYFEWDINQAIANSDKCGSDPLLQESNEEKLDELYQHFRLSVANWLASKSSGAEIRRIVQEIIFDLLLPEFEKRKRLEILLSGTLQNWFAADEGQWELPTSFIRKDCRLIDSPDSCSGACKWVAGTSGSGKCKLHIPTKTYLGSRLVSTSMLFTKRVIDELIRFPIRRIEILEKKVSEISSLIEPIRQGDQYIIPEKLPDPFSLLRLDWATKEPEKARFYEEMTEEEERKVTGEMPEDLENFLGPDSGLSFWQPEYQNEEDPLAPFASAMELDLADIGVAPGAKELTKNNLVSYVKQMVRPIGKIDLRGAEPEIMMIKPFRGIYDRMLLFVFSKDGVGLLAEFEGMPDIGVSKFPPILKEFWDNPEKVILVQVKKKDVTREAVRVLRKAEEPVVELPAPKAEEAASVAESQPTFTFRRIKRQPRPSEQATPAPLITERLESVPEEQVAMTAAPAVVEKPEEITIQEKPEEMVVEKPEEQIAMPEEVVVEEKPEEHIAMPEEVVVEEKPEEATLIQTTAAVEIPQAISKPEEFSISEEELVTVAPAVIPAPALASAPAPAVATVPAQAAPLQPIAELTEKPSFSITAPKQKEVSNVPSNVTPYNREFLWSYVYSVYNILQKISSMLYAGGAAAVEFNYNDIDSSLTQLNKFVAEQPKITNAALKKDMSAAQLKLATLKNKRTKEQMEVAYKNLFTTNNIKTLLENLFKYAKKSSDIKNTFDISQVQGLNTQRISMVPEFGAASGAAGMGAAAAARSVAAPAAPMSVAAPAARSVAAPAASSVAAPAASSVAAPVARSVAAPAASSLAAPAARSVAAPAAPAAKPASLAKPASGATGRTLLSRPPVAAMPGRTSFRSKYGVAEENTSSESNETNE